MSPVADLPVLTLLLLSPLAGIPLIWAAPRETSARDGALLATLLAFGLALLTTLAFDSGAARWQLVDEMPWITDINVFYRVAVDGLSILFLPATTLLFAAIVIAAPPRIAGARLFFSLVLALETAMLGVFLAADTMFFFLCWELTVVPTYFLVSLWGVGARRRHAATQYTLLMLAGGVPLLFGLLIPALQLASPAFDLPTLLAHPLPRGLQFVVFLLLLAGFAVKAPIPPFHTWLPQMAMEGPPAVIALVAGLKLGLYGLLRFTVPLAPEAAAELHWLLAGLGVLAMLHGALAALAQTNLRAMLAYAGVSHVGLVLLALASGTTHGVQGALLLTVSLALSTGGGFLATAFLQARTGSCELQNLGGVFATMPLLTAFFFLCGFAGLGIPGTIGFPGEWLSLIATLQTHTGAGVAALAGMVFGGAFFISLSRRVFFGPVTRPAVREAADLLSRERWAVALLAAAILGFGLWPQPLFDLVSATTDAWVAATSR